MKNNFVVGILLLVPMYTVSANETNKYFGDRSWQWNSPNDNAVKNQQLMIRCAAKPQSCAGLNKPNRSGGGNSGGLGLGFGLASGQNIGNVVNVIVTGDNNVVTIAGDQTNNGDQAVDINVNDNNIDVVVDDHSQIINGDVTPAVEPSDPPM